MITQYEYDEYNQITKTTGPRGEERYNAYDNFGRLKHSYTVELEESDALEETDYVYDSRGRLTMVARALDAEPFTPENPTATSVTTYEYDDYGQRVAERVTVGTENPVTLITTYEYDLQGRLIKTTSPEGMWNETFLDGRGLREWSGTGGNSSSIELWTEYYYDSNGHLTMMIDPSNRVTEYDYDFTGRRTKTIEGGLVTNYQYAGTPQPIRIYQEVDSETLSDAYYDYDPLGRTWRVVRRLGENASADDAVTLTTYTIDGLVYKTVEKGLESTNNAAIDDSKDIITEHLYDALGRTLATLGPEGQRTDFEYDESGNVTRQKVLVGVDGQQQDVFSVTITVYDALGRAVKVTDPAGHYRESVYDAQSHLVRQTAKTSGGDALSQQRWFYDEAGRLTKAAEMADASSSATPNVQVDRVAAMTYDKDGRLLTRTTYNMNSVTELTTEYTYDDLGRPLHTADPAGNWTENEYGGQSVGGSLSDAVLLARTLHDHGDANNRRTVYYYDDWARLTQEFAEGEVDLVTWYEYDALGRRISVTDPEGQMTTYIYDRLGRQTKMTEDAVGLARVTDSVYDRLGRLVQLRAHDGEQHQTTTYEYDKTGRRTRIIYPDGDENNDNVTFEYDLAGRMVLKKDQRGIEVEYEYDPRGLLTKRRRANAPTSDDHFTYDYDGLGRMTLAQRGTDEDPDSVSSSAFSYDDFSNLTEEEQTLFGGSSKSVTYEYDQAGNRTSLTYPSGVSVSLEYAYDALNRMTQIDNGSTLAEYEYQGLYFTKRRVRTAAQDPVWIVYTQNYDEHRRIGSIVNRADIDGDMRMLAGFLYQYDNAGNRLEAESLAHPALDERISYQYDGLHRLTQAAYAVTTGAEEFTYDHLGNRDGDGTGEQFGYKDTRPNGVNIAYGANNAANEYEDEYDEDINGEDISYDAAGNLTADENGLLYTYDFENRLIEISDGNPLMTFQYDALGRRIEKVDHTPDPDATTRFYYDGQRVVAEHDGSGDLLRYFVDGPTYIDEHVMVYDAGLDAYYYYLLKELYSVAGLADMNGNLATAYTYDAYGKVAIFRADTLAGDSDADGDVDIEDFGRFENCFGLDVTTYTQCAWADLDGGTTVVDLDDFVIFASCFGGQGDNLAATGDYNDNGVVDAEDGEAFDTICYSGPGVPPSSGCEVFDFDADNDVDMDDRGLLAFIMDTLAGQTVSVCITPFNADQVNPYFFTGQRVEGLIAQDVRHQVYYYRSRCYDPETGRFAQRDPSLYADGMNLSEYTRSNPIKYTDADGRKLCGPVSGSLRCWMEEFAAKNQDFTRSGEPDPHKRITWELLSCLACQESSFNPCAEGTKDDLGLMQLRRSAAVQQCINAGILPPDTNFDSKEKCCKHENQPKCEQDNDGKRIKSKECPDDCKKSIWNIENQIKCAAYYLRYIRDRGGPYVSLEKLICKWNRGPSHADCEKDGFAEDYWYTKDVMECLGRIGSVKHGDPNVVWPPEVKE